MKRDSSEPTQGGTVTGATSTRSSADAAGAARSASLEATQSASPGTPWATSRNDGLDAARPAWSGYSEG
jgi:hypothetical protein